MLSDFQSALRWPSAWPPRRRAAWRSRFSESSLAASGCPTVQIDGRDLISYTSFDYLGMARDPRVAAAAKSAIDCFGTSASASRLVGGNNSIVEQLDETLAEFAGR